MYRNSEMFSKILLLLILLLNDIEGNNSKITRIKGVKEKIKIGNLPNKYNDLSIKDQLATKNSLNYLKRMNYDPFVLEKPVNMTVSTTLINGNVRISNFTLTGLKKMNINNLEQRLKGFRTDFNISVPEVIGEANIDAALVVGAVFPFNFVGDFKIKVNHLNIAGATHAAVEPFNNRKVLQLKSFSIVVTADNVTFRVVPANGTDQSVFSNVASSLISTETLIENTAYIVLNNINDNLKQFDIKEIMARVLE